MSVDHSFTRTPVRHQPLQVFLQQEHSQFIAEPGRILQPLINLLYSLHHSGKAHGAVMPSCILVSRSGEIDVEFFKTRAGFPEQVEARTYYPEGFGDSLEASQRCDLQALGAVLHLIVADQPPASPARRVQRLADQQAAKDWPPGFIEMVDRLLVPGEKTILPTLREISATLDPVDSTIADPLVASEGESSENYVAEPVTSATGVGVARVAEVEKLPVPVAPQFPAIRLPNGMVGREFSAEIVSMVAGNLPVPGRIEPLSEVPSGLEFKYGSLAGMPEIAGEFEISFRFHPSPSAPEKSRPVSMERTLSLTINPDPRSLWKNTPSDQNGGFWKPDAATDFLEDGPLSVLGASLRGRSHAHVGSFRDDDMAMAWFPAGSWYSLTVADGAGSAKFSRRGSKIACDTVNAKFAEYFSTAENELSRLVAEHVLTSDAVQAVRGELYNVFGKAAIEARKAIEDQALASHATSRDFHTTLITALLHPLEGDRWFVATFSIGDGAAAIVSVPGGDPSLLTRPDGGDYAGQTVFLTMNEVLATWEAIMGRIQMAIIPEFDALILVTDGISDPRFESETALADPAAWSALWNELKLAMTPADSLEAAATAVLKWMEFHSPGHHDDRTLVMATRSSILSQS